MNYITECIKDIAIFYVIAAVFKNMVPSEKYGKYIRLFLGVVMIILVLGIVGKAGRLDSKFNSSLDIMSYGIMSDEIENELRMSSDGQQEAVISEYEKLISGNVTEYIESLGAGCDSCSVTIDSDPESELYGSISMIEVNVSRKNAYNYRGMNIENIEAFPDSSGEGGFLEIQIKNHLSGVYNLDRRNIYVNIADSQG